MNAKQNYLSRRNLNDKSWSFFTRVSLPDSNLGTCRRKGNSCMFPPVYYYFCASVFIYKNDNHSRIWLPREAVVKSIWRKHTLERKPGIPASRAGEGAALPRVQCSCGFQNAGHSILLPVLLILSSLLLFFLLPLAFRLSCDFDHIIIFLLHSHFLIMNFWKLSLPNPPSSVSVVPLYYWKLLMFIFDTVFLKLTLSCFISTCLYYIMFTLSLEDGNNTHCILSVITPHSSPDPPSLLSQILFPSLQNLSLFFNISLLFCSLNILHFGPHILNITYNS